MAAQDNDTFCHNNKFGRSIHISSVEYIKIPIYVSACPDGILNDSRYRHDPVGQWFSKMFLNIPSFTAATKYRRKRKDSVDVSSAYRKSAKSTKPTE